MWATPINGAGRHTKATMRRHGKPKSRVARVIYNIYERVCDSSQVNTSELHLARANCLINDNRRVRARTAASILLHTCAICLAMHVAGNARVRLIDLAMMLRDIGPIGCPYGKRRVPRVRITSCANLHENRANVPRVSV